SVPHNNSTEPLQQPADTGMGRSMALVMGFMMLSKALGFIREVVLSAKFGMDYVTDAYKTAFNIPCLLLSALIIAAATIFVPIYNERRRESAESASRFTRVILTLGLIVSALIALSTYLALPWLTGVMLPGANADMISLTTGLTRIMMPMALFVFLYRMLGAFLQARFHFTMTAVATCASAAVIILGITLSGGNIALVAVATLIGMAVEFLTQLPAAYRRGLRLRPLVDFTDPGLKRLVFLTLPLLIGGVFDQLYIVFDRVVASATAGDISALDYGSRVTTMVSAAFLTTIATVLYPSLTASTRDAKRFVGHFSLGVCLNVIIGLPAVAALLMLRAPVTRLVFERGAFDASDAAVTAGTMACYALGIPGLGLKELCNRAFYARQATRLPMAIGVLGVLLNIALDYLLYTLMGVSGVALASAIAATITAGTLIILLRINTGRVGGGAILVCLGKTAAATAVMCGVIFAGSRAFSLQTAYGIKLALPLLGTAAAGLAAYVIVLALLRTRELSDMVHMILNKRSIS
ncbi:MAG: murein biosynthesis integral membrane protein MurJ, partial [Oscillospiraceae bacterium]|nr:murein biosynthesis integral membrane protein MurJ [Oscillospiraceae bacterium]